MGLFDEWVQKGHDFLHDVMKELNIEDEHRAFRVTKAVLHALRDRLDPREGKDFVAQLPMVLKAVWCDGWDPTRGPDKSIKRKREFIQKVMNDPGLVRGMDIPEEEAERIVRGVLNVLKKHVTWGEVEDAIRQLPEEIRELWE
ncbi:uncharacterized protein (DUF2267 family) [Hydrogenivirga caldilitoris]|uniref:Uncharacterized protein (DUF2267 family) n=1 Tax=Hydrogenivirga caldilitoris TaxID=246264 RepID=A0A497XNX0_9AQUI|nr:DUF2267 domain-containing protein [Hydrogenivirga caldilitoris]RLJ70645.1 uncharacterized protein (DUF2267 family) [Hydrogenivirga caldilitoris]